MSSLTDLNIKSIFFCFANDSKDWAYPFTKLTMFSLRTCSFILPDSIFERFSIWLINRCILSAFRCTTFKSCLSADSFSEGKCFSTGPRIKVSGVRNSCEILAKKRDFKVSSSLSFSVSNCSSSNCCFSR